MIKVKIAFSGTLDIVGTFCYGINYVLNQLFTQKSLNGFKREVVVVVWDGEENVLKQSDHIISLPDGTLLNDKQGTLTKYARQQCMFQTNQEVWSANA